MSSIRTRTRRNGTSYTSVLWREDGAQRSLSFDDPARAVLWRKLLDQVGPVRAREIAGVLDDGRPLITVGSWCNAYIEQLSGIEEGTRRRYRSYVTRDIDPTIGAVPLTALDEEAVGRWVNGLGGAGKTVANKHGFLSAALRGAVRAKHIGANPCEGRRLPRTEREEMVFLTPSDFAVLLGYIPTYWQPLVTFLLSTGLRWGEATALRVSDVDRDNNTIRIVRAWKYTAGDGFRLGPPKSARSRRTVELPAETVQLLEPLLVGRDGDALVFINTRGDPVRSATFHDNVWQPAVRLANGEPATGSKRIARRTDALGHEIPPAPKGARLGKRPRIHDLRHSCASILIQAGVPLPVIQAQLGHENITTTIGNYGHIDRRSAAAAASAMSRALTLALPEVLEQPALPAGRPPSAAGA